MIRRILILFLVCLPVGNALAAEYADVLKLFNTGNYSDCIAACTARLGSGPMPPEWWILRMRAEMTLGQSSDALRTYQTAVARNPLSLQVRLMGYDILRANNKPQDADGILSVIRAIVVGNPTQYRSPADRVTIGRTLVLAGADVRQVLELFYDVAKKDAPNSPDAFIASGELALLKQDYALAAESFTEAAKRSPEDPDVQLGLARSYESDAERATSALNKALELNPNHIQSLLMQADNLIDREGYDAAKEILDHVLKINPTQPEALSYLAVISHLAGDFAGEREYREKALAGWATNPQVDHLIGKKLSQKYRFAEGEAYQRQALKFDPAFQPARVQLCNDLLRLGQEDEGWKLADEIFNKDPYNVVTYNLVTLRDHLKTFKVLQNDHFTVRMDSREAAIYGQRVLDLLERARSELTAKYGVELPQKITVEIFPEQKDFAIRTFGLPGGAGYLGVCFGNVVTANSPATWGGTPHNWEAILWHEFCHVITLQKTHNRMPRWLSEGISVYEELARNAAWGQRMNPAYRKMIREDQATPVSKLSGAFLAPPTPQHLQFAYYESMMVIRYVVDTYGMPALQAILTDLGDAVPINTALAKHTVAIEKLDEDFATWFKAQAEKLAAGADLAQPDLPLDADSATMAEWNKAHPNNFWGMLSEARALIAAEKYDDAKKILQAAADLYPDYDGPAGPYLILASVHRLLKESDQERAMLEKQLSIDADMVEARLRLMEILTDAKDWKGLKSVAEQVLAVNPLIPAPHRAMASAAEGLNDIPVAIEAERALLLMDPLDRAEHHFKLAKLLEARGELPDARRQVVMSLEQAPRYREAHRLLLEIVDKMGGVEAPDKPLLAPGAPTTMPTTAPGFQRTEAAQ